MFVFFHPTALVFQLNDLKGEGIFAPLTVAARRDHGGGDHEEAGDLGALFVEHGEVRVLLAHRGDLEVGVEQVVAHDDAAYGRPGHR